MATRDKTFNKLVLEFNDVCQKLEARQRTKEGLERDMKQINKELRCLTCDRKRLLKELKPLFDGLED